LESAIEIEKEYPGHLREFQQGIRSALIVPLISKNHVIGGLALRSTKSGAYTDALRVLIEVVNAYYASSTERALKE
jgi:GAF domain-containing protein